MDEIDIAQEINERQLEIALDEHHRQMPTGPSLTVCIDCDEPIPTARRLAVPGCRRCIDCQEALEFNLSHWRAL